MSAFFPFRIDFSLRLFTLIFDSINFMHYLGECTRCVCVCVHDNDTSRKTLIVRVVTLFTLAILKSLGTRINPIVRLLNGCRPNAHVFFPSLFVRFFFLSTTVVDFPDRIRSVSVIPTTDNGRLIIPRLTTLFTRARANAGGTCVSRDIVAQGSTVVAASLVMVVGSPLGKTRVFSSRPNRVYRSHFKGLPRRRNAFGQRAVPRRTT